MSKRMMQMTKIFSEDMNHLSDPVSIDASYGTAIQASNSHHHHHTIAQNETYEATVSRVVDQQLRQVFTRMAETSPDPLMRAVAKQIVAELVGNEVREAILKSAGIK